MPVKRLLFAAVIPTRNRTESLGRMLESLAAQSAQPAEVVVIDASENSATRRLCLERKIAGLESSVTWRSAETIGAASQRNQGVRACADYPAIAFFDDDILFEPGCVEKLWDALESDPRIGGVNAIIVNGCYGPPGAISRMMFRFLAGGKQRSYAGRVLGPAVNLLPEDRDDLPEIVPVEWLYTGCALYRREALPDPPFATWFTGYSLGEDLALSLSVGRRWKLANARTARVFHDDRVGSSRPADPAALAEMELFNRYRIMTDIMGRRSAADHAKLLVFELFSLASHFRTAAGRSIWEPTLRGRLRAVRRIVSAA